MTWRGLRDGAEAALVRGALGLLRRLGPVRASDLGGAVARGIGPLLPVSRVAERNLRMAMPELDAAARRRVIRGVWDNLGRTAAELPHVAALGLAGAQGAGWMAQGDGFVQALADRPGPVLFVSGHIGNWEILPKFAARYGIRLGSFYRAASNPKVDRIIVGLRQAAGQGGPQFAKGAAGARAALAFLRGGGRLGMLVDQKMNDGIAAPFFGREAMTAPAAAAFALRFSCPVVMVFVERLGPARFCVVCEPPLALPQSGDRQADIAALTGEINRRLEGWIRAHPQSWLWLHRRWPKESLESDANRR